MRAVVESVGDHGCEATTGGRVIVLGSTGRNFAAGMSGGVAFVLDEKGDFPSRCNLQMVQLERLEKPAEIEEVRELIRRHGELTKSHRAYKVLALWEQMVPKFVKVMPRDYKRVLKRSSGSRSPGRAAMKPSWRRSSSTRATPRASEEDRDG